MTEITLTQAKYDELKEELNFRETTKSKEINDAIKIAKEFGDLSENAEYSAAKDEQSKNNDRMDVIRDILRRAEIIDESAIDTTVVSMGTTVKVEDLRKSVGDPARKKTFSIVSSLEANSRENKISDQSPIGKALNGHKKGSTVTVVTPAGSFQMKILEISK